MPLDFLSLLQMVIVAMRVSLVLGNVIRIDKICTYLTKVIKSLKTVTSILIITFLNIKDTIIRVIIGLVT